MSSFSALFVISALKVYSLGHTTISCTNNKRLLYVFFHNAGGILLPNSL